MASFLDDFSLAKLIDPVAPKTFIDEYWEAKPLLIQRGQRGYYGDLLTIRDFDNVVADNPNSLKIANNNAESAGYVKGQVEKAPETALSEMREGSTLILDSLHKRLPNLRLLVRLMEREFTHRFQTNIYLTPPEAKGFKIHVDKHDVFVLQVHGSKTWRLEKERRGLPRLGEETKKEDGEYAGAVDEFTLEDGDLLYIPRGHAHDAQSTDESSMHITLGALPYSWEDLLKALVKQAADDDHDLRKALPVGYVLDDPQALVAPFKKIVDRMAEEGNLAKVAAQFMQEAITKFTPELGHQVSAYYGALDLTPDTQVGARRGMVYRIVPSEDSVVVLYAGRNIAFLDFLEEAVRFALETPGFRIRDLPGDLEDDEKVVVVERLIQEGMVAVKDA